MKLPGRCNSVLKKGAPDGSDLECEGPEGHSGCHYEYELNWNDAAAPAPTDGEVGELVRELASIEEPPENAHEMTEKAWKQYALFCDRLSAIRAALSRQSAELREQRNRVARAEDYAARCKSAHEAIDALSMSLGNPCLEIAVGETPESAMIRYALERKSAELAEAKQGKLAADLRADGWKALSEQATAELAEAQAKNRRVVCIWCGTEMDKDPEVMVEHAASCEKNPLFRALAAESALTALGCKLGPEGWMRPCEDHCCADGECIYVKTEAYKDHPMMRGCIDRPCKGTGFLPIPGAGAKGDNHE